MVEFVDMQRLHVLGSAFILTEWPSSTTISKEPPLFALESGLESREFCEQLHAACPIPFISTVQGCAPPSLPPPRAALSLSFLCHFNVQGNAQKLGSNGTPDSLAFCSQRPPHGSLSAQRPRRAFRLLTAFLCLCSLHGSSMDDWRDRN